MKPLASGLRFEIPWVPPSNNVIHRMHWSAQRQLVQTAAGYILGAVGLPASQETHRVRVRIIMYRRRALDRDNAFGAAKPIFDALVRLGYAVDDHPKCMEQRVLTAGVRRPRKPYTVIEVTPCQPSRRPESVPLRGPTTARV
jgi:hypothetical protein